MSRKQKKNKKEKKENTNTNEKKLPENSNENKEEIEKLAELLFKFFKEKEEKNKTYTNEELNKKGFWFKVWYIISNRKIENSNFLTSAIAGIMQLFFNAIALFLTIFAILFFLCIFYVLFKGENYIYIFNYVIATPTSLMLALIIRGIANEIGREKDKNYIFTAFSGIVGFVALIVALVALFKGVG